MRIYTSVTLVFLVSLFSLSCKEEKNSKSNIADDFETSINVSIGENSWLWNKEKDTFETRDQRIITKEGIRNWKKQEHEINTYIRVNDTGQLHLGLNLKSLAQEPRHLKVSLDDESSEVKIENSDYKEVPIGTFNIKSPGYKKITIASINNEEGANVDIDQLLLGGSATKNDVNYVKDNFHFGRRGPSVHLKYPIPSDSKKPQYFYNEIEVPKGEDVIGSYFMANGFSHGYFGMQVNSEKERRILFSVWSPYDTQNPKDIPEDQKIKLLDKGETVHTGEFGNEGSGGQSYRKYMWKPETTYKFLLKGEPAKNDHTDYTAYFFNPNKEEWELIASFRRPKSGNYLGSLYSFLENFVPATGNIARKAIYKNQWIYDKTEGWLPIEKAEFTADATANNGDRLDYSGGEANEGYYLKNCGFFDDFTEVNTKFKSKAKKASPDIDFKNLP